MKVSRGNGKRALAVAAAALVAAGAAWQAATAMRAREPVGPAAGGAIGQGFLDVTTPGWTDSGQRTQLPGTGISVPVPAGPSGQPDFWNYDPFTGAKTADASPAISPDELAGIWSGSG
jgi:hypothetical protein